MIKKLVTILAEELPEWPEGGVASIGQACDGTLHFDGKRGQFMRHSNLAYTMCDDINADNVTRAQWEAERARILLESQPERDADVAKVVDGVAARSAEDQALWDKVYYRAWELIAMDERELEYIMRAAANAAYAFMAERAKRMKG